MCTEVALRRVNEEVRVFFMSSDNVRFADDFFIHALMVSMK